MNNPKIDKNGPKYWFNKTGQFHREDGPAIEYPHGTKSWYLNDKLHRENGPAIEFTSGTKSWCLNGKQLTEKEWIIQTKFNFQEIIIK